MTVRVSGFAKTDLSHTARFARAARLLYPYHPLYGDGTATMDVVGLRSDMIVVRLPDGSHRGIPAWMFDPVECATVRSAPRSIVEAKALLSIVDLLEVNGWWSRTSGDECNSQAQAQVQVRVDGPLAEPGSGGLSIQRPGTPRANPEGKAGRVHRAAARVDRDGRRPSNPRRGRGR